MSDLVLVTGVSGFLGGHVALQLLNAGFRVRGSVRNPNRADKVRDMLGKAGGDVSRLEFVALDLMNEEGWDKAMDGVRYLQHVASPFVISQPRDKMELIRPAVQGTERALNAALAGDVERIVLTSSMAAIMYGHSDRTGPAFADDDWTDLNGEPVTPYIESKTLAERRAWEIVKAAGRENDLAVINPSGIFGPLLEEDPGTSAAGLIRMFKGQMPGAPRLTLPGIDVRDVAALHVAAMTKPEAGGQRFASSEGAMTLIEYARVLGKAFPAYAGKMPRRELPDWLVRIVGLFDRQVGGLTTELGPRRPIDSSRARELLGRPMIPLAEAITASGQSLIDHKLV